MIICEISQNFNSLDEAKELVRLAKENGGDLVKAQLFDSMKLYGKHTPSELSFDQAKMLFDYGNKIGIEVFFSVFDVERVKWCERIGVKRYKIAARNTDKLLWAELEKIDKPVLISYDSNYDKWGWEIDWQVLYCVSEYPAKKVHFEAGMFEDTGGLLGSSDGRREYHKEYEGFSDHTLNLTASKVAISRGAKIIERHFCVDKNTGIDAQWSMTPDELKELKTWETIVRQTL